VGAQGGDGVVLYDPEVGEFHLTESFGGVRYVQIEMFVSSAFHLVLLAPVAFKPVFALGVCTGFIVQMRYAA